MTLTIFEQRKLLIHLVRSGKSITEAAQQVGRGRAWGYKWTSCYFAQQDWQALQDRSRRPHHQPKRLPESVYQAIRQVRSELEAEAQDKERLGYVGAPAIRARLQAQGVHPLPSVSGIERELRRIGMTRPRQPAPAVSIQYPHLHPTRPHQLIQADILPHYLTGGTEIACFNAVDVVSRYPSGRQYERRTAANACEFLLTVWQEQGLPEYQQVDNEDCFSGGHSHPCILGRVVRLALYCGVQLIFSPFYHPESNGTVERFHQEYARFVWKREPLDGLTAVRQRSALFFSLYRHSQHHRELEGHSPAQLQAATPSRRIPLDFRLLEKLPLTAGQVHFMRAVDPQGQIKVLNHFWQVSQTQPHQGMWVTLYLSPQGATLSAFDAAPDVPKRTCLAKLDFPLKEPVVPLNPIFRLPLASN